MIGLYTITNTHTNKVYVGSSINVERRLKEHLNNLQKNKHANNHLQASFNRYKEQNFKFEELVDCEEFVLNSVETYWINTLQAADRLFGYNICSSAYLNRRHSPETKEKIRRKALGRPRCKKAVKALADKLRGIPRPEHSKLLKEYYSTGRITARIFLKKELKLGATNSRITQNNFTLEEKITKYKSKCVAKIDKGNTIDVYYSINEAARLNKLNKKTVSLICREKQMKTNKGLQFKFITYEEFKNIKK